MCILQFAGCLQDWGTAHRLAKDLHRRSYSKGGAFVLIKSAFQSAPSVMNWGAII